MAVHLCLVLLQIIVLHLRPIIASERFPCPTECGNVSISYPFGIGEGCYFDKGYEVICDHSSGIPKAFLPGVNRLELVDILSNDSRAAVRVNVPAIFLNSSSKRTSNIAKGVNLSEVPLLVYEFIPNGSLNQYIHYRSEEFPITWEMHLSIAVEVSGALSYLHSAASIPIYHRGIKSANILLDDKYQAKVSNFGASRSITIDQTHLTTQVQGTFGYVDPEYFRYPFGIGEGCYFDKSFEVICDYSSGSPKLFLRASTTCKYWTIMFMVYPTLG
ncbi:hypothetical protein WN944_014692 [Citrus x changshan-huyou]|uniref:Protein kinase domain-containing protein n=1 Tax=Citrus x changshan-huyou TaxID=2935761 RepID=A0AAP0M651_9ROSI